MRLQKVDNFQKLIYSLQYRKVTKNCLLYCGYRDQNRVPETNIGKIMWQNIDHFFSSYTSHRNKILTPISYIVLFYSQNILVWIVLMNYNWYRNKLPYSYIQKAKVIFGWFSSFLYPEGKSDIGMIWLNPISVQLDIGIE